MTILFDKSLGPVFNVGPSTTWTTPQERVC